MGEGSEKSSGQSHLRTELKYAVIPLVYMVAPLVLSVIAAYQAPDGKVIDYMDAGVGKGLIIDGAIFAFYNASYALRRFHKS